MAHGGFKEAIASSMPTSPATSFGVEGEMARVSIASLLEGAGLPVTAEPDRGIADHVGVNQHGMIMDLYSSGSLSSVTLDFGLATSTTPATGSDIVPHDLLDAVTGGTLHAPLAGLLHELLDAGNAGAPLGFAGEQRVPDDMHALFAGQSALGGFDMPLAPLSVDTLAMMNKFEPGHHELLAFGGDGLPAPITEQHFIA